MYDLMVTGVPQKISKWHGLRVFKHQESEKELIREKEVSKIRNKIKKLRKKLICKNKEKEKTIAQHYVSEINVDIKKIKNEIDMLESQLLDWGYDIY